MIVYNNIIPFKGYKAMAFWPFIFVRNSAKKRFTEYDENHERIHLKQQVEMLLLLFYLWYGIEWFIRFLLYWNTNEAYKNISFEQEAYLNEGNLSYNDVRSHYAWVKYLTKKTFISEH